MFTTEALNAIETMNNLGKNKIPFLFVIDFEMKMPVVMKLSDFGSSILYKIDEIKNFTGLPEKKSTLRFEKFRSEL